VLRLRQLINLAATNEPLLAGQKKKLLDLFLAVNR